MMKPTSHETEDPVLPERHEIEAEINQLIEANRVRCFWFAPKDYLPVCDEQRFRALRHIESHGDRQAFMQSRKLQEWLLRISNAR